MEETGFRGVIGMNGVVQSSCTIFFCPFSFEIVLLLGCFDWHNVLFKWFPVIINTRVSSTHHWYVPHSLKIYVISKSDSYFELVHNFKFAQHNFKIAWIYKLRVEHIDYIVYELWFHILCTDHSIQCIQLHTHYDSLWSWQDWHPFQLLRPG